MKVRVFSEDYPDTVEFDWPAVPRVGDIVSFNHRGGRTNQSVAQIFWVFDANGEPVEVEVHLTY